MESFLKRLKYYGFGFGLGLVFVFFFFKNRGCTWTPENRVKNTILGRVLVVSDAEKPLLKAMGLSHNDLIHFLDDGDVQFGHSKKHGNPLVYSIVKEINKKEVELWFTLPDKTYISEVIVPKKSIQNISHTTTGLGRMIHFPNVDNIVYLDENDFFKKEAAKLGLANPKYVQNLLNKSGEIDFKQSNLTTTIPEQVVRFQLANGKKCTAKTIWFQEHIKFVAFLNDTVR